MAHASCSATDSPRRHGGTEAAQRARRTVFASSRKFEFSKTRAARAQFTSKCRATERYTLRRISEPQTASSASLQILDRDPRQRADSQSEAAFVDVEKRGVVGWSLL